MPTPTPTAEPTPTPTEEVTPDPTSTPTATPSPTPTAEATVTPATSGNPVIAIEVEWFNESDESVSAPADGNITIDLYDDKGVYDSVTLNNENGWRATTNKFMVGCWGQNPVFSGGGITSVAFPDHNWSDDNTLKIKATIAGSTTTAPTEKKTKVKANLSIDNSNGDVGNDIGVWVNIYATDNNNLTGGKLNEENAGINPSSTTYTSPLFTGVTAEGLQYNYAVQYDISCWGALDGQESNYEVTTTYTRKTDDNQYLLAVGNEEENVINFTIRKKATTTPSESPVAEQTPGPGGNAVVKIQTKDNCVLASSNAFAHGQKVLISFSLNTYITTKYKPNTSNIRKPNTSWIVDCNSLIADL